MARDDDSMTRGRAKAGGRGAGRKAKSSVSKRARLGGRGEQPPARPAKKAADKAGAYASKVAAASRRKPARDLGNDVAQRLAAIVESSDAAIIGETLDGVVTSWNASAEKILGYSAAEMIGQPIHIIAAPSRPQETAQILERIRGGERVLQYETEQRRKDGRIVQVALTVSPIRDESGRIVGASKIVHDITDRKNTEARLEEFAHFLELAPAMVRTLDGEVLFWGQGLTALYGWSPQETIGRTVSELLKTEFPLPFSQIQAELLEAGEWQGELVQTHRDGHGMVVLSQWVLHRDRTGKPVSVLRLDWNVTEAKQAQSMVEEREARLRSILETSPNAIITIDAHGIIQSFSDAAEKLFGYAAGEVIGHNVKMLMPSPHRENHDAYLERYLSTGEKRIIGIGREVEAQRKDGTIFPMELAVGEVKLGGSRIFTGFIRDLTSRVKMEQDLRQAQKMEAIGQLTGGVAHDFNNLLTVILGNLEMLEGRLSDAEDREILKDAQEASQLGAELAKRLLAFGRRQPLHPRLINLNALAGGMVDLLRRSLGEMIAIEPHFAERLPMVMVDPGQVENALLNLAVNARDAMPQGGRLVIETTVAELDKDYTTGNPDVAPGRYVTLSVTDTGAGMTPEVRQRAFEPFFTTKGPGAGTGLGLSMVYGFVKQSGGHVQLYSEVGHGTTVRLYLPAQGEEARAADRDDRKNRHPAAGETILVVEDDQRVRRISVRRLKELGYAVIEADSGPAALKVLNDGRPIDLLFTDIVMAGGMTGVDLAHEARRRRPRLKILFTSGYAGPAVIKGEVLTSGSGWLGKPYSINELEAKLRELLGA